MTRISIDTGGTFTDGFVSREDTFETRKVPTTKHDLTACFRDCIDELAKAVDETTEDLLLQTQVIRFSTTIGTNTIIERSGPKIGLIVTEGYQDDFAELQDEDGNSFIKEDLVVPVSEQTTTDGVVESEIDHDEVVDAAKKLMNRGAQLLTVSFENSFHNPKNEQDARRTIESEYPPHYLGSLRVLTANEVSSRPGYHLRTNTAILNGYIHGPMARSLYRSEENVREAGYKRPLLIGQSTGGASRVSKTIALNTYDSGPVAGLLGADAFRKLYDIDTLITSDMGGTSTDIGTIVDGEFDTSLNADIEGYQVSLPVINITTAGAGGGSIASVENGDLSVGPESSGAEPGPACYDLGGFDATVTDADVALGYVNPDYFLGGERKLDDELAESVIKTQIAEKLDIATAEAAAQIRRRVDRNIARTIEKEVVARGASTDDATLLAYGGAGPTHACTFAEMAGIERIITSPNAAAFSAFGASTLDVTHRYENPFGETITKSDPSLEPSKYNEKVQELQNEAAQDMRAEGFDEAEISSSVSLVISTDGDSFEIEGPAHLEDGSRLADALSTVEFDKETPLELESVSLTAVGPVPSFDFTQSELKGSNPEDARKGQRQVYWEDEWLETPVYQREELEPGNAVKGQAVIEAVDTNYVVPEGWTFRVDKYLNGIIEQ
jgi:N-methylhydantoinase A/acetophenone carboxylase